MIYRSFFTVALVASFILPSLSACKPNNQAAAVSQSDSSLGANTQANIQTLNNQAALPDDGSLTSQIGQALQANLNRTGIHVQVLSVTATDSADIYQVNLANTAPVYTDKTGTYVMQGNLISLSGDKAVNLSEQAAAAQAKEQLSALKTEDMIVYSPRGGVKAAVYVFSDPTCQYCQMLHQEIDQINDLGIEVRYLAWPRSEQTIPLAEAIWCSKDRKKALTDAKLGRMPHPISCQNPVKEQVALGFSLGVTGTPAIFTQSGEQIGGYLPADELARLAIAKQ